MDPTRIALFDLAEKRLQWTAQRQNVLAANIANANTPGYKGRDLQSFDKVLAGATAAVAPAQTQPAHLGGTLPSTTIGVVRDQAGPSGLDGNNIQLDAQLTRVADTETTQGLVTNIWKTYMGMFNTALGKSV